MNLWFYLFFAVVAVLFVLFVWSLRKSRDRGGSGASESIPEDTRGDNVTYLPQIRQALAKADYQFVAGKVSLEAQRRMRRERRNVALAYLKELRADFDGLLRTARVIASLSPEVVAVQEWNRLRLMISFRWRYRMIWLSLQAGFTPLPQLNDLSKILSGFSVRLEDAMIKIGERAALVGEMASAPGRGRINPA